MERAVEQTPPFRGILIRRQSKAVDASVDWHGRVVDEIIAGVRAVSGGLAARRIETEGVELLHAVIDARDVGRLRDHVIEALRNDLLRLSVRIGRAVLGWRNDFYVDDYLILRVNFPYDVARQADPSAENPGIGHVSPGMREAAKALRVIDPVFDPATYHDNHPPAAWAHGPHRDSWVGHSRDGINIWWAISDVPAQTGIVLYPELNDTALPSDPRSGYLQAGYPLPRPTYLPLSPGEMLVFDPEILHGTHLNVTDRTRVAVSMRLNAKTPEFDPACFFAREFWRRASLIKAGAFDEVLQLKREEHLAVRVPPLPIEPTPRAPAIHVAGPPRGGPAMIGPCSLVADGHRIVVEVRSRSVMLVRVDGALRAFESACPHYGRDLADGGIDDDALYCPGCGVAFDLENGHSSSRALKLRRIGVREENGAILLDVPQPG